MKEDKITYQRTAAVLQHLITMIVFCKPLFFKQSLIRVFNVLRLLIHNIKELHILWYCCLQARIGIEGNEYKLFVCKEAVFFF